jgi:hypothetical protein
MKKRDPDDMSQWDQYQRDLHFRYNGYAFAILVLIWAGIIGVFLYYHHR